jgi:hypothetical protein
MSEIKKLSDFPKDKNGKRFVADRIAVFQSAAREGAMLNIMAVCNEDENASLISACLNAAAEREEQEQDHHSQCGKFVKHLAGLFDECEAVQEILDVVGNRLLAGVFDANDVVDQFTGRMEGHAARRAAKKTKRISDEQIAAMDSQALEFWTTNKTMLLSVCEQHAANSEAAAQKEQTV